MNYEPCSLKSMAGDVDPIVYAKICYATILECRVEGHLNVGESCSCVKCVYAMEQFTFGLITLGDYSCRPQGCVSGPPGVASTHHSELFSPS